MLNFLLTSSLHGQNPWLTIFWCGKVWFTAVFVTKALFLILFLVSGCLCYLDHLDRRKIFRPFSCCSSEIALTCNIDKLQPCKNRDVVRRRPFGYFLSLVFSYSRECPSDVVIGLNSIVVYYVDVAEKAWQQETVNYICGSLWKLVFQSKYHEGESPSLPHPRKVILYFVCIKF